MKVCCDCVVLCVGDDTMCFVIADVFLSGTQFYGPWLRLTGYEDFTDVD